MKVATIALLSRTLTVNQLILIISCYFVVVFNFSFLSLSFDAVTALNEYSLLFLLSIPLLLLALMTLFFSLLSTFSQLSLKLLLKPIFIMLIILSAMVFYGTTTFGVVFDYGMIQNSVETHSAEAFSYINPYMALFLLLSAGLPVLWVINVKVNYPRKTIEVLQRLKLVLLSLMAITIIAYSFYPNYAAVGRNNSVLKKYLIPFQYLSSSYKYISRNYLAEPLVFKVLDENPVQKIPLSQGKNIMVMVVGETARAKSFAYNGYEKNTNPYTENLALLSFSNMRSCGTATAVSVPCMFSALSRADFTKRKAVNQQNLLDLAQLAGVDVLWLDNNSGCQGVCERVPQQRLDTKKAHELCDGDYCFDEVLLEPLKEKLSHLSHQTTLIVLHMIGSHGPTYYRRYPSEQALFLPDCQRSDIQNCSQQALVNTYDNTIAYTDFFLSKVIKELMLLPDEISGRLLYISDHGESLGEHGSYLHGFPYALGPEEQKHVPMLWWSGDKQSALEQNCSQALTALPYDHDNIFHSMLGLLNVQTSVYNEQQDIFAGCRADIMLTKNSIANPIE